MASEQDLPNRTHICDKTNPMNWIYLSPHLDDAVLSCGGLIWKQSKAGHSVFVWTICAGDPPETGISSFAESLHSRWETGSHAGTIRRQEDIAALQVVGASHHHFSIPDCIYRNSPESNTNLYPSEELLANPFHPDEWVLIKQISNWLQEILPKKFQLVCPYAYGGHVDHQITRAAAEFLGKPLWYYLDFPYIANLGLTKNISYSNFEIVQHPISGPGLQIWINAVAQYKSQISTFWSDKDAMHMAIKSYVQSLGGIPLLKLRDP